MNAAVDIRLAGDRFHTVTDWLDSWHSFSFARHYDPTNTNHGLLLVSNEDRVVPGRGFGTHHHRDMEIVTWVLEGSLAHRDSEGNESVIYPGLVQHMSAGSGISHSEMNASSDEPVHFLQMWVLPETGGLAPSYGQADISHLLASGEWASIASGGEQPSGIRIHQRDATLWVARPREGSSLVVPEAPQVHLYVARGSITLAGHALGVGDAVRLDDRDRRVMEIHVGGSDTEILAWATGPAIKGR